MDDFMRGQIDAVHRQLDAANRWRWGGRRYHLHPAVPRDDAAAAFRAGSVELVLAPPQRIAIRMVLSTATMGLASALVMLSTC